MCTHTHTYVIFKILQKQPSPRLIEVDFHGHEHKFKMYVEYLMFIFSGWHFA